MRFIRLLFCYNFVQSKTNRRRANEPQRHDIMAEDENTSRLISAYNSDIRNDKKIIGVLSSFR